MRFAFIDAERATYPITVLCRVMQVTRGGYHAWNTRKECGRRREDRILTAEVVAEFERSRRTYGSPRIRAALRDRGIRIGRGRTARLMRERGLSARRKKAFRTVPKCCDGPRVAPNRLQRKFSPRKPGRSWVTDVKYVRTKAGWLYLAPVIDLFSRRVVGYAMSTEHDANLALAALSSATGSSGAPKGVLLHSDRGGIYGDEDYVLKLKALGIRRSMSRTCNPWDNAVIESFFSTLRFELLDGKTFADQETARRAIAEWIDGFYNPRRRHSTIGNTSPVQFELAWQMRRRRT
jgi:putative transposase